jgi:hypothetical protein
MFDHDENCERGRLANPSSGIKAGGGIALQTPERYCWNRLRAAKALDIRYQSLMYRMKGCNLRNDAGTNYLGGLSNLAIHSVGLGVNWSPAVVRR